MKVLTAGMTTMVNDRVCKIILQANYSCMNPKQFTIPFLIKALLIFRYSGIHCCRRDYDEDVSDYCCSCNSKYNIMRRICLGYVILLRVIALENLRLDLSEVIPGEPL